MQVLDSKEWTSKDSGTTENPFVDSVTVEQRQNAFVTFKRFGEIIFPKQKEVNCL